VSGWRFYAEGGGFGRMQVDGSLCEHCLFLVASKVAEEVEV
jgi:hypothetical protein